MDIDHFKRINDKHGHAAGDVVLKEFAAIISKNIRHADIFGRYGGEEFLLIMPNTNVEQAKSVAENLRHLIANYGNISFGEKISLTISIGISSFSKNFKEKKKRRRG